MVKSELYSNLRDVVELLYDSLLPEGSNAVSCRDSEEELNLLQEEISALDYSCLDEIYHAGPEEVVNDDLTLAVCNFVKLLVFDRIAAPVALVVCLTLICTILLSQIIGGILPVAAEKLHVDPAVMASPLITTIVDTTTLLIYFNIAKMLLHL